MLSMAGLAMSSEWRDGKNIYSLNGTRWHFWTGRRYTLSVAGMSWAGSVEGHYRDLDGDVVAFEEGAGAGPLKPLRQLRPLEPLRGLLPLQPLRALRPLRPIWSLQWSRRDWNSWIN